MKRNFLTTIAVSLSSLLLLGFYSCLTRERGVERDTYDVVILGSGPGGLTAGIYTSRAVRDTLIIEGEAPGGLLTQNPTVENWPSEEHISGYELMKKMRDHAMKTGCTLLSDVVTSVDLSELPYKIVTRGKKVFKAKSLIIAMGTERRKLGCPGEKQYWGMGVSACATCDAPFFKDKKVFVVGGGATALTEAHHLSLHAREVIVLKRGEGFKTIDPIKYVVQRDPNIKIMHSCILKEIKGDGEKVTHVVVQDVSAPGKPEETLTADGVFIAIGFLPRTELFVGQLKLDGRGYIEVSDDAKASKEGVFAAGDIIHPKYQQANVAAADGCKAAFDCVQYLDLKSLEEK